MLRTLLGIGVGAAAIVGGIYLYKKYGGGRRKVMVAHVAGTILGDKLGGAAGFVLAGPTGAVIGSVMGAVSGAMAAEDYIVGDSLLLEGKSSPRLPS